MTIIEQVVVEGGLDCDEKISVRDLKLHLADSSVFGKHDESFIELFKIDLILVIEEVMQTIERIL